MADNSQGAWHFTRMLMLLCWLGWIMTFFVTVTLLQAVLQIRVVAQITTKDTMWFNENLVTITPLRETENPIIEEMLVRYYLEMRYSTIPDKDEMERRWGASGIIARLSSPAVYKAFMPNDSAIIDVSTSPPRVVDVIQLEHDRNSSIYKADVDLYDFDGRNAWRKTSKRVAITFVNARERVSMNRHMANPNGFAVVNFTDDVSNVKSGGK